MVFVNSWSHVNSDVLSLIIDKLTLRDAVRFGAVCPQWHTLFKSKRNSLYSSPWLYKKGIDNKAVFYSIADGENIEVQIPEPKMNSRRCIGANNGYLVTVNKACKVDLLQPLTGKLIELPPIETLDFIEPLSDSKGHVKAYLNYFHTDGDDKEFVAPCKMSNELCSFASVSIDRTVMMTNHSRSLLFFARDSDQSWTTLIRPEANKRYRKFDNIISYENVFYTSNVRGKTCVWVPKGHSFELHYVTDEFHYHWTPEFKEFEKENPEFLEGIILEQYKSTLSEKYLIGMCINLVQSDDIYEPILVLSDIMKVVRWDEPNRKWKHVKSLGDKALFYGINQPVYFSVDDFPELRKNSIYFSNKEEKIICLSDDQIKPVYRADSMWITPKLVD